VNPAFSTQHYLKEDLYDFLEDGQEASMMDTHTPLQQGENGLHLCVGACMCVREGEVRGWDDVLMWCIFEDR
jgi:hypothetical protein